MRHRHLMVLTGVVALAAAGPALAGTDLYLRGGAVPVAQLSPLAPTTATLLNQDPDRDAYPGIVLEPSALGVAESDPTRYQLWMAPATGLDLDDNVSLLFWATMKDFARGARGVVAGYLLDCDPDTLSCTLIAETRRDVLDWSGGFASWRPDSLDFGHVTHSVTPGRSLAVKVTVGADADDAMWLAYASSSFPSRLTSHAASDIVIDCDFGDWADGRGTEMVIDDQGGPDDWSSPARLDITRFGVSANTTDAFHFLIGIDDVPAQGATAATLLDTDVDGNTNYALVVEIDDTATSVKLYACDDSQADGCGAPTFQSYPTSFYCATTAPGPWDQDTMIELAIPYGDLPFSGGDAALTSLVSYAATSLLTSPKDSIFGDGSQVYDARIYYDTDTGTGTLTGAPGPGFEVRRNTSVDLVRAMSVVTTVASGPFSDLTGTLGDGLGYFYLMRREGGIPVRISAHRDQAGDSVRLGFDDGDPLSAPVDASASLVTVDSDHASADGTDAVEVTVVPKDAAGSWLGRGLDLAVDEAMLSPAALAGPVEDLGNGRYRFRVVSLSGGNAVVQVNVEGVVLFTEPALSFQDLP